RAGTGNSPPRMRRAHSGGEVFLAECQMLRKIGSQESGVLGLAVSFKRYINRQHRREARDVVVPERAFDLGQVGFIQEGAISGRLEVDAADFNVQRIFLQSDLQVSSDGAQ